MKFYLINYNAENPQKYASAYICENSFWKDKNLFAGEYKSKHELPIPYYFIQPSYELLNEEVSDCEYIYIESLKKKLYLA